MNRYFIVNEFFGSKIYDSLNKNEWYFDFDNTDKIKKILNGNFIEINNKLNNNGLSTPLKISMNITKKCNLKCEQCFSCSGEKVDNELSTKEIYTLFDKMKKHGTFFICLGGGEPLFREDIFELLDYACSELAISLVTNGLLLTKEIVQKLSKRNLDTLWISLDGLEKNHEKLRGKGTFKKTISSLKLLKNYTSKKAIRVALNKYNINEINELIKIAENLSIDIIRFTPLLPYGRAKNKGLTISQDEYISFLNDISKKESKVKIIYSGQKSNKFWIDSSNFGCHCGKEAIWIDEIGNFSPCFFWGDSYNIGNIKNESFLDLWKKSLDITDNIEGNDICKECSNYLNCRGGCRMRVLNQLNNLNDVDPLCPLKKNLKVI